MTCDADEGGMLQQLDPRPAKGPRVSFVLPKYKIIEEHNTLPQDKRIKFRVVFCQYRHSLKSYG